MLDFYKMILSKVSFDKNLLIKEIKKSLKQLSSIDIVDLQIWCYREFGHLYKKELDLLFVTNSLR